MKQYEAPQAERLELMVDTALAAIVKSETIVEDDDLNVDDD